MELQNGAGETNRLALASRIRNAERNIHDNIEVYAIPELGVSTASLPPEAQERGFQDVM